MEYDDVQPAKTMKTRRYKDIGRLGIVAWGPFWGPVFSSDRQKTAQTPVSNESERRWARRQSHGEALSGALLPLGGPKRKGYAKTTFHNVVFLIRGIQ